MRKISSSGDAHEYAVRRLELILNPSEDKKNDPYYYQGLKDCFRSDRYKYQFRAATMHCHYESGHVETTTLAKLGFIEVKFPSNLMINGEGCINLYHPKDVAFKEYIRGEDTGEFKSLIKDPANKPCVVTLNNVFRENNGREGTYKKMVWHERNYKTDHYLRDPYNSTDRMEVEMYFNNAPLFGPGWYNPSHDLWYNSGLDEFVTLHPNVFIHVKYAYIFDYKKAEKIESYNYFNNSPGFQLFITPFTESDWKVLNHHIVKLGERQCIEKMREAGLEAPSPPVSDAEGERYSSGDDSDLN